MEVQKDVKPSVKTSAMRIVGAIAFALLVGTLTRSILNYSILNILVKLNNISIEEAYNIYHSSALFDILLSSTIVFFVGSISGFLARKGGFLVGILANMMPILMFFFILLYAVSLGANPLFVFASSAFFQMIILIFAAGLGGMFGQHFYKEERDLDLHGNNMTIFGIHIGHYLWIAPVVYYPFLSALAALTYSWIFTFSTDLYFISRPNLWINVAWWFYFIVNPVIIFLAAMLMVCAFVRFWKIMQYKQRAYTNTERVGLAVFYGFLSPVFVRVIANFASKATYNMYKPVVNDWKIGAFYILFIPAVGLFLSFAWWVKNKIVGVGKKA